MTPWGLPRARLAARALCLCLSVCLSIRVPWQGSASLAPS